MKRDERALWRAAVAAVLLLAAGWQLVPDPTPVSRADVIRSQR